MLREAFFLCHSGPSPIQFLSTDAATMSPTVREQMFPYHEEAPATPNQRRTYPQMNNGYAIEFALEWLLGFCILGLIVQLDEKSRPRTKDYFAGTITGRLPGIDAREGTKTRQAYVRETTKGTEKWVLLCSRVKGVRVCAY